MTYAERIENFVENFLADYCFDLSFTAYGKVKATGYNYLSTYENCIDENTFNRAIENAYVLMKSAM